MENFLELDSDGTEAAGGRIQETERDLCSDTMKDLVIFTIYFSLRTELIQCQDYVKGIYIICLSNSRYDSYKNYDAKIMLSP